MSSSKYKLPEYEGKIQDLKFKFGEKVDSSPLKLNITPTFAYDYISLNQTDFCFNNVNMICGDFISYFFAAKRISSKKISDLFNGSEKHFHIIDLMDKNFLVPMIRNQLGVMRMANIDQFPVVAQFEVETDTDRSSPRAIFLLGKYGVFHILFFDKNHAVYPAKNQAAIKTTGTN